jgi:hypothetical protein
VVADNSLQYRTRQSFRRQYGFDRGNIINRSDRQLEKKWHTGTAQGFLTFYQRMQHGMHARAPGVDDGSDDGPPQ